MNEAEHRLRADIWRNEGQPRFAAPHLLAILRGRINAERQRLNQQRTACIDTLARYGTVASSSVAKEAYAVEKQLELLDRLTREEG